MIKCVKCGEVDAIAKSGIIRGKQRFYCKRCDYYFTQPSLLSPETHHHRRHQTTIMDIASALQISKSTVSRALQGHSDINANTRKAVLDMAHQLDYQPNLLALGLAKSRSFTLGIIVPEFINSFFPYIIIGAQQVANPAGYHVIICQSNESLDTEIANTNVLMASRVDGVVASVTAETKSLDHFHKFQRAGIPLVMFNRICDGLDVSKVLVDDYDGAYRGVEHLIQQGCTRIAHLAGPQNLQVGKQRLQGYLDALRKYGLPVYDELIVYYNLTKTSAQAAARQLLELPTLPDSIFAVNDPAAIETILIAKSKGIKIPSELAIVGFSNEPTSALIEPGLTTLAQPLDEIGKTVVQLLLHEIESEDDVLVPRTEILKTQLIVRGSSLRKPLVS
ncbi:LacI family DNA-binding transcriptional regulator [Chryseolinea lacunae]|uniref:LacI family DNA-binding transcriptional regulator n=1 Tax=Chryseolinea lacunae TaxID=2801331 RepID=A0ABS1KUF6_9BACT|nr:substrate-binding domain-containing protein [Chryseolinea lacunae]MBL0743114.1 LacI family DNA-binding transcriptional regulator [Chryseolinea lacunae]